MIRNITLRFEEEVFEKMEKKKDKHSPITWEDFIMLAVENL